MKTTLTVALTLLFLNFSFTQNTTIPDSNFELALINKGLDSQPIDGLVPTQNIDTVKVLAIFSENISSLHGISAFTALEELYCQQNNLNQLDLSSNANLKRLKCSSNNIGSLDFSTNASLQNIDCSYNPLNSLTLRNNSIIDSLVMGGYQSNLSNLTNVDFSNQPNLTYLYIRNTEIQNIDLSNNQFLTDLIVLDNPFLSCLNIKNGNNIDFKSIWATHNPTLSCIAVSDTFLAINIWSTKQNFYFDFGMQFSENCPSCLSVGVNQSELESSVKAYPNPSNGLVNVSIDAEQLPATLTLHNSLGQRIDTRKITSSYSSIELPENRGLYFLELVDSKQRKKTFKILRR